MTERNSAAVGTLSGVGIMIVLVTALMLVGSMRRRPSFVPQTPQQVAQPIRCL